MNAKFSRVLLPSIVMVLMASGSFHATRSQVAWVMTSPETTGYDAGDPDDPAYTTYREGYRYVLEEQWEQARKELAEVIAKYRTSPYVDDAQYWIAYSWKSTDIERSLDLYRTFLRDFPTSPYYDDAIADLTQLQLQAELAALPHSQKGHDKHIDFMIRTRLPAEMQRLERELARLRITSRPALKRQVVIPSFQGDSLMTLSVPVFEYQIQRSDVDPKLRVRVDALRTLSREKDDLKTFRVLTTVAEDARQPLELRETAVEGLAGFSRFDVQDVLLNLARKDTNERILTVTVETLARTTPSKRKSLDALTKLFNSLPTQSTRQLGTTLFAIAEIGDDRATDFIIQVARSHPNFDMRSDAVFYLGNIGTEKARTALRDILMQE